MKEHIDHHRPPFDKHYCILTGRINGLLDSEPLLLFHQSQLMRAFGPLDAPPHGW